MRLSVCLPVYEMDGKGDLFLKRNLDALSVQETDFEWEVVVSDNSKGTLLENVLDAYPDLTFTYVREPKRGMAPNTNSALKNAKGEVLKILYQDDFLFHRRALQELSDAFTKETQWLATGYVHSNDGTTFERPHYPTYNELVYAGNNTIGFPSCIAVRNPCLFMDEELTWLIDCDYYWRYYEVYGPPTVLNTVNTVNWVGEHQTTSKLSDERKQWEYAYMLEKHDLYGNPD